jgi:hypothetical protein
MTPSGIESATFRFVAQHLNHCSTAIPIPSYLSTENKLIIYKAVIKPIWSYGIEYEWENILETL